MTAWDTNGSRQGNYTAYASLSSLTDSLCRIKKIMEGDEVMQQGIDNRNADYM